ncbi:hypothetical protein, partial [Planococcus faecalis]
RPLKRFIQRTIETNIARELIGGGIVAHTELELTMDDNKQIVINKKEA